MSQTQTTKSPGNPTASQVASAPSAAVPTTPSKPTTDVKPPEPKVADSAPAASAKEDQTDDQDDDKKRNGTKIYVIVGTVHEFDTASKAEAFLNGKDAPASYTTLRGKPLATEKRLTLR